MNKIFDMYSKNVMKYFMNPKNIGRIDDADAVATVGNPRCGDVMKVFIKIGQRSVSKIDNSKICGNAKCKLKDVNCKTEEYIKDIKVETLGCGAAIATSSMATEMVKGKNISQALKISNKTIVDNLGGLPKVKYHCSLLAEQGIKDALNKYLKKSKSK